ncbi:MAG TPA: DUF4159 domain-containing protein [Blastocatellia bacterium]|nr:DUF4159 domain-containing protein [Blastocatellia bacterium]
MDRRTFIKSAGMAAAAVPLSKPIDARAALVSRARPFVFARIRYSSGNWDADPKMPENLLNSIVEYTSIEVEPRERVVALDGADLFSYPFAYLTGNELVRFTARERENLARYVQNGGFLFVDDCNHDVDGLFAKTFEQEIDRIFPGHALRRLPDDHSLYRSFFDFPEGPPATSHELNGWGDDMIHDYLQAIEIDGRIGLLYSNKDYGCEWNYDYKNKRFSTVDNTKFGVNIVVYALTH